MLNLSSGTTISAPLRCSTCSRVTPSASSSTSKPRSVTSSTQRSVITRCTTSLPVSGSVHSRSSLWPPSGVVCSMMTITRRTPETRSIAPPMPFTRLPGIIQLARSPRSETCIAPRIARSMWPPRIMANESALEKVAAPGTNVTVSFPALIRSASTSASRGYGPMPSRPFSDCSITVMPSRDEVGHERGDADAEVDVEAIFAVPARRAPPSVFVSMPSA